MRPGGRHAALEAGLLCLALALGADASPAAEVLRIGGTGASLATFRILAADFAKTRPGLRVEIPPSLGSGGGIRALADGALDVAVSARRLTGDETARRLTLVEYGTTPLAFVVGPDNPCTGVTLAQVSQIYAGTWRTWRDGTPIRLVLRPAADTDASILLGLSPQMSQAVGEASRRPGMIVADNDQDNVDAIESLPGAFGACTIAQLRSEKRRAKAVALDGVTPTPAELRSGAYPAVKHLYIVTRESPPPVVKAFLDHLFSKAGQQLLTELGHVPARDR